jgi:2,3-bisphosphoglycerate-dependent phosphoglycerate mutase
VSDGRFAEGHFTRGREPRGTRLVLIRHGEARCNADGVVGGPLGDGGLTDLGREQAGALATRLAATRELADASALYTSVLGRSIETAGIVARALPPLDAVADCDLCELHPGAADALTWTQMRERYGLPDWNAHPEAPFAPDGESWLDFYERCRRVVTTLVARHPRERVVCVVHGGVIEQVMKVITRDEPAARLGLRTEHCSITEIEFDGEAVRLLRYNDVAPLSLA